MEGTLTKEQADARIYKALGSTIDDGWRLLDKGRRPLMQTLAELEGAMAAAESPQHVELALKAARLHARTLGEAIVKLMAGLETLDKVTDDDAVMAASGKDLLHQMKLAATTIEEVRDELRLAKQAFDRAEKFLADQSKNADSAGEDWALAVSEFDRITAAAAKEAIAWRDWETAAKAAVAARDLRTLDTLRKAPPDRTMLDRVAALPRNKPFAAFDKAYPPFGLPLALRNEMTRDREKAMVVYERTIGLAIAQGGIAKRVRELSIEPPDVRKALAALKLPAAALDALRKALMEPAGRLEKALEMVARKHGLAGSGRQFVAVLARAGVL